MIDLNSTTRELFQASSSVFWAALPVAFLLAMMAIYFSGEISGSKIEGLFRRLIIAIALLVGFMQISSSIQGLEMYLIQTFGGDDALIQIFSKIGDKATEIKDSGTSNWLKLGQIGLSIISTLSFLVLAVVKRFLDILHLSLWNLLHILGPIALLGCLFPTFHAIPKGIFMGMLELSLWKPIWVILARLLLGIGFSETPANLSQWFDTAVLNFAVAGLLASTPMLVHSFLNGQLASAGASALQTMTSGMGASLSGIPISKMQTAYGGAKSMATTGLGSVARTAMKKLPFRKPSKPNISKK
ncbi:MAG: hypothetical protein KA715_09265 [Xanthomonadaceae bacterium]|nr:hypothetical protein [Xanthomonadaceae bacterium]